MNCNYSQVELSVFLFVLLERTLHLQGNQNLIDKTGDVPWGWTMASALLFSNVKKALGLDACRLRATGAAPIALNTMHYFMSLDMPLFELYGMSESSGPHSLNLPTQCRIGSVGVTMTGAETWIDVGKPYAPPRCLPLDC